MNIVTPPVEKMAITSPGLLARKRKNGIGVGKTLPPQETASCLFLLCSEQNYLLFTKTA
jgi:hypothetical protein